MKQREIWEIDLDPTIGAEIKKKRPCVILNDESIGILPLKVIAPITSWNDEFEDSLWMVKIIPNRINNLKKISVIDCFQVRAVSEMRLIKKIGEISFVELEKTKIAMKAVFDID
ncbi:MAG: type II toxin-antitoxin system PemK/MazF family toxin [bacterium]